MSSDFLFFRKYFFRSTKRKAKDKQKKELYQTLWTSKNTALFTRTERICFQSKVRHFEK